MVRWGALNVLCLGRMEGYQTDSNSASLSRQLKDTVCWTVCEQNDTDTNEFIVYQKKNPLSPQSSRTYQLEFADLEHQTHANLVNNH